MIGGLSRFVTDNFIIILQNILLNYTSEFGYPMPVAVRRAYNYDPITLPEIWVESEISMNVPSNLIGASSGDLGVNYAAVIEEFRCPFGVMTKLPVERDDLYDFIMASLTVGVDASSSTKRSWQNELFGICGIQFRSIDNTQYGSTHTTRYGDIFEARGEIICSTTIQTNTSYETVTKVTPTLVPSLFSVTFQV